MSFLDMRTVIFISLISYSICALVMLFVWLQGRKRFAGTAFWVIDFACQAVALFLIILRGSVPDWASMILSNTMVVGGSLLGYIGYERFTGKTSSQIHNYIILAVFVLVHIYFSFIQPDLAMRSLNVSAGILIMSVQASWLMLFRVPRGMRPLTLSVGLVNVAFCIVSIIRVIEFATGPHTTNDFFKTGGYDALMLVLYQILLVLLTYSLILMINLRLEREIRADEEKFAKAFHSSPYAITITGLADGKILDVNDGFVHMTGYQRNEVVGKTTPGLGLWAHKEDRDTAVDQLSRGGKVYGSEYQFRKKSGESLTGLFSADIITISGEVFVLSSINDITDRKLEDERLQELTRELERSNRDLEQFAYVASHDLREPLRSITQYLDLLSTKYHGNLDKDGEDFISFARDGASRLQSLIADLLTYARMESRSKDFKLVNSESVLKYSLTNLQAAIEESGAMVTHDTLPEIKADEGQLTQLLQNLVANAIKFRADEPAHVHISVRETAGEWEFSVRDNGIGIDSKYQERVFVIFQRLHSRAKYPGTGIGLALCKKIVEHHNGRIWFQSEPGKDTTFFFTIPK